MSQSLTPQVNAINVSVSDAITGTSNTLCTQDPYSLPLPPGPFSVDHFQVGKDNVQLRSPVKYRVQDVEALNVTGVQTVLVDNVSYFGRTVNGKVEYLTYPLPLTIDVLVPSTRHNKLEPQPFYPDESAGSFFGHLSLDSWLACDATVEFQDGTYDAYLRNTMSAMVPNSLASRIAGVNLSEWQGLSGKYLLDNQQMDALSRLSSYKQQLSNTMTTGVAGDAYTLLTKIMGSHGVPILSATDPDAKYSIAQADRLRALQLIQSSGNYQLYKNFKCYAKRHPAQSTKRNDIYNPVYEFNRINRMVPNGKVPMVIVSEPSTIHGGSNVWEALASYGIAVAICHVAYTSAQPRRCPGKTTSIADILQRGVGFPDLISLKSSLYYGVDSNYTFRACDATTPGLGYIDCLGYDWSYDTCTTGTSSLEFCEDMMTQYLDTLQNTTDLTNSRMSSYIDFNNLGVFGRSGGQEGLTGATMYNSNRKSNAFKVGVAHDILLSFPYTTCDYYGFSGGVSAFPKGLVFPVMFVEPAVDQYGLTTSPTDQQAQSGTRGTVGSRKQLQNIFRSTSFPVRAKSMFLEASLTGHCGENTRGMSREFGYMGLNVNGVEHPDRPRWPDVHRDPVFGLRDVAKNRAYLNYALANTMVLYYRMYLSPCESISGGLFRFTPFNHIQCPWDIPGADDYQFGGRAFKMDVGGKFDLSISHIDTLIQQVQATVTPNDWQHTVHVNITDPTTEGIFVEASTEASDVDLGFVLTSPGGQIYNYQNDLSRPANCLIDIRDLQHKTGSWKIVFSAMIPYGMNSCTFIGRICSAEFQLTISDTDHPNGMEFSIRRRGINLKGLTSNAAVLKRGDLYQDNNGFLKIAQ